MVGRFGIGKDTCGLVRVSLSYFVIANDTATGRIALKCTCNRTVSGLQSVAQHSPYLVST